MDKEEALRAACYEISDSHEEAEWRHENKVFGGLVEGIARRFMKDGIPDPPENEIDKNMSGREMKKKGNARIEGYFGMINDIKFELSKITDRKVIVKRAKNDLGGNLYRVMECNGLLRKKELVRFLPGDPFLKQNSPSETRVSLDALVFTREAHNIVKEAFRNFKREYEIDAVSRFCQTRIQVCY